MLYFYGLGLGIQSLLRGKFSREAVKNIIVPVNYWRAAEYTAVFRRLRPRSSDRILDIGSPKLLSLFLAERYAAEVFSTDIEPYFLEDYRSYRMMRKVPEERFHVETADGRSLRFEDNFFSKIFSISVLEHIPDNGDADCAREIGRTLNTGGVCVLTVPFSPESRDEFRKADEFYWSGSTTQDSVSRQSFFQRRYSEEDLHNRLIRPSGLALDSLEFIGERFPLPQERELSQFLPPMTGVVHPMMSGIFLTPPVQDRTRLNKPLAAIITLVKN
jgi:SAM-dependent methyltransferase